jgi:DNA modification methylase
LEAWGDAGSGMKIEPTIWHGCYDKSLKGLITNDSFAHPAKMSLALCERIIDYCLERGWLKKGDLVGDPFNGVCTVGLVSAYRGLRYVGVELEPKFVKLSQDNIELHRSRLTSIGRPIPIVIQGDSRKFAELIANSQEPIANGVVSSPPYADTTRGNDSCGIDWEKAKRTNGAGGEHQSPGQSVSADYGRTEGQIGSLNGGSVDTIVSSPPWEDNSEGSIKAHKFNYTLRTNKGHAASPEAKAAQMKRDEQKVYGDSPGQIGKLKGGTVDAAVTSPPFAGVTQGTKGSFEEMSKAWQADPKNAGKPGYRPNQTGDYKRPSFADTCAATDGNIEKETAETYWSAVAQVYASCFQAIKPGGVICLVVKDYIKAGKRVPLCEDTARLLEHTGFVVIERIYAMLVKETVETNLDGTQHVNTKSRKSFFRRLYESKPGRVKIDFEEVIIAQKPTP